MLRECLTHMPLHVYDNSEYARFAKDGLKLEEEEDDRKTPVERNAEKPHEEAPRLPAERPVPAVEPAKDSAVMMQKIKALEEELARYRDSQPAMVPSSQPSGSLKRKAEGYVDDQAAKQMKAVGKDFVPPAVALSEVANPKDDEVEQGGGQGQLQHMHVLLKSLRGPQGSQLAQGQQKPPGVSQQPLLPPQQYNCMSRENSIGLTSTYLQSLPISRENSISVSSGFMGSTGGNFLHQMPDLSSQPPDNQSGRPAMLPGSQPNGSGSKEGGQPQANFVESLAGIAAILTKNSASGGTEQEAANKPMTSFLPGESAGNMLGNGESLSRENSIGLASFFGTFPHQQAPDNAPPPGGQGEPAPARIGASLSASNLTGPSYSYPSLWGMNQGNDDMSFEREDSHLMNQIFFSMLPSGSSAMHGNGMSSSAAPTAMYNDNSNPSQRGQENGRGSPVQLKGNEQIVT